MNLGKKKALAARALKVGRERIIFIEPRLQEIKEAITKQDIRDLHKEGAILIKEKKGRRKIKRKKSRSMGNVRKRINTRKKNYVLLVRGLRKYTNELKNQGKLSKEEVREIRNKIRNKDFKSKTSLREYIKTLKQ
jgi:large subunit ribosomal protein L19e